MAACGAAWWCGVSCAQEAEAEQHAAEEQPEGSPRLAPPLRPLVEEARPVIEGARRLGFFSGRYERAAGREWTVEVEPSGWYASPGGSVAIGGGGLVETSALNLDSPVISPYVESHVRWDPWKLSLSGSLLTNNGTVTLDAPVTLGATTFFAGETVDSRFRLDSAEVKLGYSVYAFDSDPDAQGVALMSSEVDLVVGARYYDFGFRIEELGGAGARESGRIRHVEPLIGVRADVTFEDRYEIEVEANVGGSPEMDSRDSRSGNIQAAFKYRPSANTSIQIGYRLRVTDLRNDVLELNGAVAGLFGGVSIRF
jgi:hypothetical protein